MGERGIIMSAESVRAILAGTKTQTRRLVRFPIWAAGCFDDPMKMDIETDECGRNPEVICNDTICLAALPLPYAVGNQLWVRETWKPHSTFAGVRPRDIPASTIFYAADDAYAPSNTPWRSPIHMPRWASRLTLTVTDVRVQRLQDISEADALAEGIGPTCQPDPSRPELIWVGRSDGFCQAPSRAYRDLWNSIHGPDAWDRNPWICAISFTTHHGATHGT